MSSDTQNPSNFPQDFIHVKVGAVNIKLPKPDKQAYNNLLHLLTGAAICLRTVRCTQGK
jgi:hypothetical protein